MFEIKFSNFPIEAINYGLKIVSDQFLELIINMVSTSYALQLTRKMNPAVNYDYTIIYFHWATNPGSTLIFPLAR